MTLVEEDVKRICKEDVRSADQKNGCASPQTSAEIGTAGGIGQMLLKAKEKFRTKEKTAKVKIQRVVQSGKVKLSPKEKVSTDFSKDMVNSPEHYASSSIECIDAMEAMTNQDREYKVSLNGHQMYCWQVIFKYIWRFPFKKNSLEDLKKAQWYLNRLIEGLENK